LRTFFSKQTTFAKFKQAEEIGHPSPDCLDAFKTAKPAEKFRSGNYR
jgi:hypothetical protein